MQGAGDAVDSVELISTIAELAGAQQFVSVRCLQQHEGVVDA
jgi:hypothetical protein